MAAWQPPKTDWEPHDGVRARDFNRIEGNIEWLNNCYDFSRNASANVRVEGNAVHILGELYLISPPNSALYLHQAVLFTRNQNFRLRIDCQRISLAFTSPSWQGGAVFEPNRTNMDEFWETILMAQNFRLSTLQTPRRLTTSSNSPEGYLRVLRVIIGLQNTGTSSGVTESTDHVNLRFAFGPR